MSRFPLLPMLAAVALVFAGRAYMKQKAAGPGADAARGGRVNPEPFKAEIMALEVALNGPFDPMGFAVDKAASELNTRVFLNPLLRGREDGEEFFLAMSYLTAEQPMGGGPSQADMLRVWERGRDTFFSRADWFSANRLTPASGQAVNAGAAADALKKCLADASALIASAQGETLEFDRKVDLRGESPDDKALLERWRTWVPGWQARVQSAAACMPEPTTVPLKLGESQRFLTQIFEALASPPNPGPGAFLGADDPAFRALYVPDSYQRDNWLSNATHWIEQCTAQVDANR